MTDDIPFPDESYRPEQILFKDWPVAYLDRPINYPVYKERDHYLATARGFDAGGFELMVREVDVQAMADARMLRRGVRKPVAERDERDMIRAAKRAKTMVRLAVKQIGCDHLLTVTTREDENTPESMAIKWKAFVRAYRKNLKEDFPYVAVPERHPSNPKHWHLHVAIRGRLKLKIARHLWWSVCGGRGMGNVDVRHIKVGAYANGTPKGPLVRAEKIARYISKYMTKDLTFAHRADKKRYWRSAFSMPEARHYWLRVRPGSGEDSLNDAFNEVRNRFGGFAFLKCSFFMFPDGSGFWCSYNPDARDTEGFADPPPF